MAMPPLPFSPVKFSGLIERVRARLSNGNVPRDMMKGEAKFGFITMSRVERGGPFFYLGVRGVIDR